MTTISLDNKQFRPHVIQKHDNKKLKKHQNNFRQHATQKTSNSDSINLDNKQLGQHENKQLRQHVTLKTSNFDNMPTINLDNII